MEIFPEFKKDVQRYHSFVRNIEKACREKEKEGRKELFPKLIHEHALSGIKSKKIKWNLEVSEENVRIDLIVSQ